MIKLVSANPCSFTEDQIHEINRMILERSPDPTERHLGNVVRDAGMIGFLLDEMDTINNPFEKAAVALRKIALRHPFMQGNKRTAVVVANIILYTAGYELVLSGEKLNCDVRKMIYEEWDEHHVLCWIKDNSAKIGE